MLLHLKHIPCDVTVCPLPPCGPDKQFENRGLQAYMHPTAPFPSYEVFPRTYHLYQKSLDIKVTAAAGNERRFYE